MLKKSWVIWNWICIDLSSNLYLFNLLPNCCCSWKPSLWCLRPSCGSCALFEMCKWFTACSINLSVSESSYICTTFWNLSTQIYNLIRSLPDALYCCLQKVIWVLHRVWTCVHCILWARVGVCLCAWRHPDSLRNVPQFLMVKCFQ